MDDNFCSTVLESPLEMAVFNTCKQEIQLYKLICSQIQMNETLQS